MDASAWSSYSTKYNGPTGNVVDAATYPIVKSAFETMWFPQIDRLLAEKSGSSKTPLKVLSLACGTGAEIQILCDRYNKEQVSVLATDFAEGMVQLTQSLVERLHKSDMVTTRVMDAMEIDLDASSLDIVVFVLGPMMVPDANKVFKEIKSVLKPGGLSIYLTPGHMQVHDIMAQARKEILESCGREKDFFHIYDVPMFKRWGSPEELRARLEEADTFKSVESRLIDGYMETQRGAQLEVMINYMLENPGVAYLYEGGLTAEQKGQFRQKVFDAFHKDWPTSEDKTLLAKPYMLCNAAYAYT